jgi:uncharacterized protein YlxW (UPF0749 family)
MQVDASLVLAIGGIITAVLAYLSSRSVDRRSARRDEVQLLREEIERLQKRVDNLTADNEEWRKKYERLYKYVLALRKIMSDNDINIPDLDIFGDDELPKK